MLYSSFFNSVCFQRNEAFHQGTHDHGYSIPTQNDLLFEFVVMIDYLS